MNKILIFLFLVCMPLSFVAQNTYYYKQVKKVYNGTTITNVSGGQFITFMSDICYESDKKGIGVGHGILTCSKGYSTHNIKIYLGESYWGKNTAFKFTNDLSTLNIVTENGNIYLYKRTTAPDNVTTCSLIRTPSPNNDREYNYPISYPVQNATGGNYSTGNNSKSNDIGSSKSISHQCRLCNGTGRKISLVHPADATQTKWCNECNKTVGTGHFHTKCDLCDGNGWIK